MLKQSKSMGPGQVGGNRTPEDLQRVLSVNLTGPLLGIH